MSAIVTEPATKWSGVLTDLAWIMEWAERFPNYESDKTLDWARQEIARIGRHLDQLPAEHQLRMPAEEKYLAAMDLANMN